MGLQRAHPARVYPSSRQGASTPRIGRRRFLGTAGVAAGAAVLAPSLASAHRRRVHPRPVPAFTSIPGLGSFHFDFPGRGHEPITITDFRGVVGITEIQGVGVGSDTPEDPNTGLVFDADMRFMRGEFIATDGMSHHGTFGFV